MDGIVQGQFLFSFSFLFQPCFRTGQKGVIGGGSVGQGTICSMDGNGIGRNRGIRPVGLGVSVVGIVIFNDAIRIGGFVAPYVLYFSIRTGAEVIVGVVDTGGI